MPSFDIVCQTDPQEVDNAVNQAVKEIGQRYDFRGSKSKIEWDKEETITLTGDDEYKLDAVRDVLHTKLIRRGVAIKNLDASTPEPASEGTLRQTIKLQNGIPKETSKEIAKTIKQLKIKVQAQIQEDQVRVSGKKRDDLQQVIQSLKGGDWDVELKFVNMRD
ncbi:MAG: YajQ family cyclic di-GMP-binding protein [Acidobacteriota bacterium]